jgi:capsular exopolysaccharide synthesis family protein
VDEVRNAIAVYNQKNTYVFVIQVKSTNAEKSARIANALADLYIQEQIDVKYQATENAVTWLSERVASLAIELEDQEKAVTDFQSQMQVGSIEGAEAMSQRVRDMRDRSLTTAGDLARVNAQLARLQSAFDAQDVEALATALDDPNLRSLVDQARNGDGEARTAILARTQVTIDRLTAESQRIEQQLGIVNNALRSLEDQFNEDSQQLIELQQLQRDSDATRTLYEIFLTRLKETSVQRGLQQADTRVLSEATPGIYVEPRKSRIVLVSFILGAMVGAVASLVRQFLYSGVRTVGELEQVSSHHVLGQIPLIPIRERKALLPYLGESSTSVAVEAVRNLRTSLLLSNLAQPPQVILSTSGIPGDGKTTLALSLAHNLAGLGKKVMLLDGDMRRRTLNEYFNIPENQMGWNELGPREDNNFRAALYRDPGLDADILVAADSRMNAADVFSSDDFRALLADLRRNYDYIVLDTPPLLLVPDSRIIAPLVDAILVSVAWNKTPRHVVKDVVRMLGSEDPNKIGFVLTQVSATGMRRYGDGGHYGAYGGYGHGYYAK